MMPALSARKYWFIMQRIYRSAIRCVIQVLIAGSVICLPLPARSDNPYNDQGVDLKSGNLFNVKPQKVKTVQLEADQVGFSKENGVATAEGNVVVTADKNTMYTDSVQVNKAIGEAVAHGHVYIDADQMQVDADSGTFNFNTQTGEFKNARVINAPFQLKGETVAKLSDTHMVMKNGYMTTCDHDEPHFRLKTRQMDVYAGDKAVARGITMFLGKMPLMHFPKYVQDLKNKPIFVMMPGYKKDFGMFLLTELRLKLSDQVRVVVHGDVRERTGFGQGVDVFYDTPDFGSGLLKTYYTYENQIAGKRIWSNRNADGTKKGPTTRHELYKIEWRHKWQIDQDTNVIWQYYKIHDHDLINRNFLKRYFEREYRRGPDVNTYFVLTRNLPVGSLTYRVNATRINKELTGVDYLPEVRYDLSGQRLGETNFYLKTTDTFSNIQNAQPDNHMKTMRLDTDNEISYPKKIGFVETRPWVGGQHTYYSRTKSLDDKDELRGQFKTGLDLTTHFYKVWNYRNKIMGVEINRLRHVITPSIAYKYAHRPTLAPNRFNQFDAIDALDRAHVVKLSLENKLQTKRNNKSVDLIRWIVETDYQILDTEPGRHFGPWLGLVEFNPADWLHFKGETSYEHRGGYWNYANFDVYINKGDKWAFGVGKRFARDEDDQLTTELIYKINPKWKFKIYERFLMNKSELKEEDYILTRDLHEWEMDINFNQERGQGMGFYLAFRLKAFPDSGLNLFSTGFHRPKAGSQSNVSTNY